MEDAISTNTSGNSAQQNGTPVHPQTANQNRRLITARVSRSFASPKTPFDTLVPKGFGTEFPVRNHQHLALNTPKFSTSNFSNAFGIDIH